MVLMALLLGVSPVRAFELIPGQRTKLALKSGRTVEGMVKRANDLSCMIEKASGDSEVILISEIDGVSSEGPAVPIAEPKRGDEVVFQLNNGKIVTGAVADIGEFSYVVASNYGGSVVVLKKDVVSVTAHAGNGPAPIPATSTIPDQNSERNLGKRTGQQIIKLFEARQFDELKKQMTRLRIEKAQDERGGRLYHDVLWDLATSMAERGDRYDALKPDGLDGYTISGAYFIQRAWAARGTGFGSDVTKEGAKLFKERLDKAQSYFEIARELGPESPYPLAGMIIVDKTLGSRELAMQHFTESVKLDADYMGSYSLFFDILRPRWGGNQMAMLKFVRSAADSHPQDAHFGMLVLMAHNDASETYDDNGRLIPENQQKYMMDPVHWAEIEKYATRQLLAHPNDLHMRNLYAKMANLALKYDIAQEQFRFIGDDWDKDVWHTRAYFDGNRDFAFNRGKQTT